MRIPRPTFEKTLFSSNGMLEHLVRGIVGIGALSCSLSISEARPLASLAVLVISLVAFRGCPICWSIGMIETTWRSLSMRNPEP